MADIAANEYLEYGMCFLIHCNQYVIRYKIYLHWYHRKNYNGWWGDSISGLTLSAYSSIHFRPLPAHDSQPRELIIGDIIPVLPLI
jgi:hypothetical protein